MEPHRYAPGGIVMTREQLLVTHYHLQAARQAIGKLGWMLRRTKPGSARHLDYLKRLTRLEHEATLASEEIAAFIRGGP